MDILTIDFETYYDKEFSLSKVTTEEYVRSKQFETIGVAVKVNDGETEWYSGTKEQVKFWLGKFNWGESIALAHNAMFDMAILNWQFGYKPKKIADTLSMARAIHGTEVGGSLGVLVQHYQLGEKGTEVINALGKRRADFTDEEMARYASYCINDVDLTYELFKCLVGDFPITELELIDLTIRMFTEPVLKLDKVMLASHLVEVRDSKETLLKAVTMVDKEQLMSNHKFAGTLKALGVEPPMKISPTTGKETYAFSKTDEGFKALLEHERLDVQALAAARLGVKSTIEETRTERFIEISYRGPLPIPLRYYAAHTGRWGGDDKVNMQNLPRSSPLKDAIVAPDGYFIVDSDSSQIEARTLAWLAEQNDLVEAFDKGEDVYKIMASAIYGRPQEEITKAERFVGKTTILGCFGADTKVLTDSGWKRIVEVQTTDMVWDGEEWVKHQGVVPKGVRETITAYGIDATPEHEILTEHGWREWYEVVTNRTLFQSALDKANLPLSTGRNTQKTMDDLLDGIQLFDVTAAGKEKLIATTSNQNAQHDAALAPRSLRTKKDIGSTSLYYRTKNIVLGCLTEFHRAYQDVTTHVQKFTRTTGVEALLCTPNGVATGQSFLSTYSPLTVGETLLEKLIGLMLTKDTSREILGLQQEQKTCQTEEKQKICKRKLMTYDIAYAGPRNRFTIATNAGVLIVHNCGYGMGAAKFKAQLKTFNVNLPEEECKRIITVYRETYPRIPQIWRQAGNALLAIANEQTAPLGREGALAVEGSKGIRLPNGLYIKYPNLRRWVNDQGKEELVYDTKKGKAVIPNRIYGGKVTENVCQALARIVIAEQMLLIAKKYKVVMTVHDAIACIVPENEKDTGREFVEMCMRIRPRWAPDLPLNCESGVNKFYGRC